MDTVEEVESEGDPNCCGEQDYGPEDDDNVYVDPKFGVDLSDDDDLYGEDEKSLAEKEFDKMMGNKESDSD